jgi:hypothetical protein
LAGDLPGASPARTVVAWRSLGLFSNPPHLHTLAVCSQSRRPSGSAWREGEAAVNVSSFLYRRKRGKHAVISPSREAHMPAEGASLSRDHPIIARAFFS